MVERELRLGPSRRQSDKRPFVRSSGEFETCPTWVPVMDTGQQFARIALKTMGYHPFDQRADRVAKVRNVSSVGSHPSSPFS
jgi:hypothetical protein